METTHVKRARAAEEDFEMGCMLWIGLQNAYAYAAAIGEDWERRPGERTKGLATNGRGRRQVH